ncbi:hypothetical protein DBV23_16445 [Edwardsiella ictaluri]|uniref:NEL-type E3 ubiquitin ligase domain-containing protein n=1 Tax=Edwardsiella ictaluri TaxID=67780 RepID=UPI000D25B0B6|nr:NEL-type E3 ubiquitin ligase domain-containing protein [Edwardsiella ictaluri]AVZ83636.1 hypothetical protein DBV23_16445 [Edwardsiella ictaluri]EKS7764855.1 hypothetical protein [Edwardsiella ictaluri]EKS7771760.1 hypothetical protein [Edwardsiella ictaluri]EKS7774949.1 hypothetical protein [Edwardsiella ictaluri]EKS7778192.1 hypothetical protein [Edwardsiella ictaluri]
MPLYVGSGYFPATISNNRIQRIVSANITPDMSVRENVHEYFNSTHKSEALTCIQEICHPPAGTTRDAVVGRFGRLRGLAYPGFADKIKSGDKDNGDNRLCILDENGQEMLSVILGDDEKYTVIYPNGRVTHDLSLPASQGDEGLLASCTFATAGPQTADEYEAVWLAWERAAPPAEAECRTQTVQKLRQCMQNDTRLDVSHTPLTSLPPLPTGLQSLDISYTSLTKLPPLPDGLQSLDVSHTSLTKLPTLPHGLQSLNVSHTSLIGLPLLPHGLQSLDGSHTSLTGLPPLPQRLQSLDVSHTSLTGLPPLLHGLQSLDVSHTSLTQLPTLPQGLQSLNISHTSLTDLQTLPSKLQRLDASHTSLAKLQTLPSKLQKLDVSHTSLTELPKMPSRLETLNVSGTKMTKLSSLPYGLKTLNASNTLLTRMPRLYNELQNLDLSNTTIDFIGPFELPYGLQTLDVSGTRLIRLPQLPTGLQSLNMSHLPLKALPHMPSGLQTLNMSHIQKLINITHLPTELQTLNVSQTPLLNLSQLPTGLQSLNISDTPLYRLPSLPPVLQMLDVSGTNLINLPESLARLSRDTTVLMQNNHMPDSTIQLLRNRVNEPDYQGPRIEFDRGASSGVQETNALHLLMANWMTIEEASDDRWKTFWSVDDARAFSMFLNQLKETKNNKSADFRKQIATWLTLLANDDELRAKTFAMATESTSSCEDRVTLAMNSMKSVQLLHNAEKGKFDNDIPGLVSVGREMFRLEKLELIAREKIKTLRDEVYGGDEDKVDEIEVFLGYQNQLKKSLELTGATDEMRYFDVSDITESDLQAAEIQVKTAEDSQFGEWILQWEPLHKVLIRKNKDDWDALIDKKIEDYEREYQELYDTELEPAGLVGDIESERTIGARAMASTEKLFQQGLRPLAEKLLGKHLGARWLLDASPV